jgi:hypothetical protein
VLVTVANVFLVVVAGRFVPDLEWRALLIAGVLPAFLIIGLLLCSRTFRREWVPLTLTVLLGLEGGLGIWLVRILDEAIR